MSADLLELIEAVVDELLEQRLSQLRPANGPAPWLTLEQAAECLGCSVDAVRMRAKRGRLESRHQGRRIYVSRGSVDDLA